MLSAVAPRGAKGSACSRGEGTGTWRASNRALTHAVVGRLLHGRWVSRVGHDSCTSAACTASETADVLGEVVITATLGAALPVTCAEGDDAASSSHTPTTVAPHATSVVSHVLGRWHHGRRSIAVTSPTVSAHRVTPRPGTHSWEGAAEAGRSALEVGEAAGRAGPVSGAGSVLAGREGGQNLGSAVEHAAGGGRDLDGLLVESAAVHAQALGSLEGS